eukprot:scaffold4822_cov378-Prasinococcus_capsulatus_cf.AAC.4
MGPRVVGAYLCLIAFHSAACLAGRESGGSRYTVQSFALSASCWTALVLSSAATKGPFSHDCSAIRCRAQSKASGGAPVASAPSFSAIFHADGRDP